MGFLETSLFSFSWHYLFALHCQTDHSFYWGFPCLWAAIPVGGPWSPVLSSPHLTSPLLSPRLPYEFCFPRVCSWGKKGWKMPRKRISPSPKTRTAELISQVLLSSKPGACLADGLIWNTSVLDGGFLFMCFSTVRDFSHLCGLQKGLGKDKPPTWDHLAPWQLASQPGGLRGWPAELGDLWSSQKPSCRKSFSFPHHCWSADVCFPPPAGSRSLRSPSKADVICAETCQISWPFWHAPKICSPRGCCGMTCSWPKAVVLLGPRAWLPPAWLIPQLPEPLHFPDDILKLQFDFGEDLGFFPPSSLRTGMKYNYFNPPEFSKSSPPELSLPI